MPLWLSPSPCFLETWCMVVCLCKQLMQAQAAVSVEVGLQVMRHVCVTPTTQAGWGELAAGCFACHKQHVMLSRHGFPPN